MKPAGVARPTLIVGLIGGALFGIARTTGSGWLVVLLAGMVAVLVAGAVLPPLALRRLAVAVAAPPDATATRPLSVDVTVKGRGRGLRVRALQPGGEEVRVDPPATGQLTVIPSRRGLLGAVTLEVRTSAPLGFVSWRRQLVVGLPRPVEVGPLPVEATRFPSPRSGAAGEDSPTGGGAQDESVRGVRDYLPGDAIRLVHWPASARTGDLMVKELEAPASPRLALVVDVSGPEDVGDAVAARAAGLALAALRRGVPVTMLTAEAGGPVVGPVGSGVEVGRRLARAVAGVPPEGPLPAGTDVVRVAR